MNKRHVLGIMAAACTLCTLSVSSVFGFGGRGFNDKFQRYQWDNNYHHSVLLAASRTVDENFLPITKEANANPPGQALSGNNAQSLAQGFDTRHRGKDVDFIEKVQLGLADIEDYVAGLTFAFGDGINGAGGPTLSLVGKTITIGIWSGDVAYNDQRRDNALYTQDYVVKAKDLGEADRPKTINCPFYIEENLAVFNPVIPAAASLNRSPKLIQS